MNETSQSQKAYKQIRRDILTCRLEPGSLIAQGQLVERYLFGLTPIREALKRLEQEGFVLTIPRFGYRITPITPKGIDDLYDLRLILETAAVRLAIQRASDAQIEEIKKLTGFRYTFGDPDSYLDFLDHNTHFHTEIARLANNPLLVEQIGNVLRSMTRIFNLGLDLRDSADEMEAEHLALTDAISRRDMSAALTSIETQLTTSRNRVLEMLAQKPIPVETNDWLIR